MSRCCAMICGKRLAFSQEAVFASVPPSYICLSKKQKIYLYCLYFKLNWCLPLCYALGLSSVTLTKMKCSILSVQHSSRSTVHSAGSPVKTIHSRTLNCLAEVKLKLAFKKLYYLVSLYCGSID